MRNGKRLWERQIYEQTQCCWCEYFVPEEYRTLEHLIPKRHGGQNVLSNAAMACASCNNRRGSLDDAFTFLADGTYDLQRYLNRHRTIVKQMGNYYFNQLCCPKKNKLLLRTYKEVFAPVDYQSKFKFHPFQENL